jgi:hypothetical protein
MQKILNQRDEKTNDSQANGTSPARGEKVGASIEARAPPATASPISGTMAVNGRLDLKPSSDSLFSAEPGP